MIASEMDVKVVRRPFTPVNGQASVVYQDIDTLGKRFDLFRAMPHGDLRTKIDKNGFDMHMWLNGFDVVDNLIEVRLGAGD